MVFKLCEQATVAHARNTESAREGAEVKSSLCGCMVDLRRMTAAFYPKSSSSPAERTALWCGAHKGASARAPLPHAEHGLLRQGMAELPRQHGDLSAMMSVMRDEVAEKSSHVGAETFDAAIGTQGSAHDDAERFAALFEGAHRLRRRDFVAVQLLRNVLRLAGLQPHHAHVVHVGEDGSNVAALAVRGLSGPGLGRKIVDQVLIDAVVGVERIEQGDRNLSGITILPCHCVLGGRGFGHAFLDQGTICHRGEFPRKGQISTSTQLFVPG